MKQVYRTTGEPGVDIGFLGGATFELRRATLSGYRRSHVESHLPWVWQESKKLPRGLAQNPHISKAEKILQKREGRFSIILQIKEVSQKRNSLKVCKVCKHISIWLHKNFKQRMKKQVTFLEEKNIHQSCVV